MFFNKYITIIARVCITVCIYHGNTSHGNDKTPSLSNSSTLMQVNIQYYNDFFDIDIWKYNDSKECFNTFKVSTFMAPYFIPVLRCRERFILLRPEKNIRAWQQMQKKQGYILLNMPKYRLNNLYAYISPVENTHPYKVIKKNHPDIGQVTGIFLHHTENVRQYIIQNKETGKTSYINATPSHKFYMENKKLFAPISQFTDKDTLLDYHGKKAKLLCGHNEYNDCGKPIDQGKPIAVYNLEVYPQHTYYVGKQKILVHNCTPSAKPYTKIDRMSAIADLDEMEGGGIVAPAEADEYEGTLLYDFFKADMQRRPFHLGYKKPNAWQFGKNRKYSHAFLYRKLNHDVLFLEYVQTDTDNGIIFSQMPEETFDEKNYEFAAKPAKTFLGHKDNHQKDFNVILDELFSFENKPYDLLNHNCQHFCQHVERILTHP